MENRSHGGKGAKGAKSTRLLGGKEWVDSRFAQEIPVNTAATGGDPLLSLLLRSLSISLKWDVCEKFSCG